MLLIEARKEKYNNNEYTSGRLLTKNKKTFTYGKIEARIKFPGGKGTWPAFWMMGNAGGWPNCGEIDIMEHVGSIPNRASFALHTVEKNGTRGNNWHATKMFDYSLADDFHTYAVEWAQEEKDGKDVIRFFVDGVQYAEQWETKIDNNDSWPFNKPHFIILNLAIGGTMGGSVDDAIFNVPRIMYVDYVRVYQRTEK
jgi:beta-glucanase (GH16 family)